MDFNFKKSLVQNFLRDKNIVNKIVEGAEIDKDTLVIEIGSGDGSLSYDIINKCGYAYLFEIDNRLEDNLNQFIDIIYSKHPDLKIIISNSVFLNKNAYIMKLFLRKY